MRLFTKEEIERIRKSFINRKYENVPVDLQELQFSYFLIPQDVNIELPDFAMMMRGLTKEDGSLVGVSTSVDYLFRPYWAALEFIEAGLDQESENRCLNSLEKELELISSEPSEFHSVYIRRRRDFFRNLVDYATRKGYDETDIQNFIQSRNRLEELVKSLPLFSD